MNTISMSRGESIGGTNLLNVSVQRQKYFTSMLFGGFFFGDFQLIYTFGYSKYFIAGLRYGVLITKNERND